jgi:hypothetical protein
MSANDSLATSLFGLGVALADFELRIALADHVDPTASFDDLAIWVAVLQRANAANNFHRIDLVRFIVYVVFSVLGKAEYSVSPESFNGKDILPNTCESRKNGTNCLL